MSATAGLAGVVLAAGAGTRLRPLTDLRPKALVPVGGVPLLDHALARITPFTGTGPAHVAVNAHHHAEQIAEYLGDRAHLSVEAPVALGTAGALGALRDWVDGRGVLLTNADAFLPEGAGLVDGHPFTTAWDGERCRLACVPWPAATADFVTAAGAGLRYVGVALMPWRIVRDLAAVPSGLYEVSWRHEAEAGALELCEIAGPAVDCGTVADYLRANLAATGGCSSVGRTAVVKGQVNRCVVWDGARVEPHEELFDVVRASGGGRTLTVGATVPRHPIPPA